MSGRRSGGEQRLFTIVLILFALLCIPRVVWWLDSKWVYDERNRTRVVDDAGNKNADIPVVIFTNIAGKETPVIERTRYLDLLKEMKIKYSYLPSSLPPIGTAVQVQPVHTELISGGLGEYTILRKARNRYYIKVKVIGMESRRLYGITWYLADHDSFKIQYLKRIPRGKVFMDTVAWSFLIYMALTVLYIIADVVSRKKRNGRPNAQ